MSEIKSMRVIQGMFKMWSLSSGRFNLNDKGCNKAELHSIKNCIRRDISELQYQRRQRQR